MTLTFSLLCMGIIALGFGLVVIFFGYRLFLLLLPVWGFVFGFALGAQAIQVIFSEAFLATVTSWVVGFIVGAIFAVLSYLFYFLAVGIISFSLGYALTVSVLSWIGLDFGFLAWIIAVVIGVVVAVAVYALNLQKYAIIVATAAAGTGVIIYTLLALFGSPVDILAANPVKTAIDDSVWWLLFFVIFAALGIVFQIQTTRAYEVETYDRWSTAM
jgi:hypothetical protein